MEQFVNNLKNKNFFCLWSAQIISQFGDRINQMALIGLIASRSPGSTWGLAKLLSFTIIPVFIVGPVAGVYVDRWSRRSTLIVCDFLRGLLVLTIPLIFMNRDSMLPIYGVVFLVFCLSRFYVPAKMSIIPDLVSQKDLVVANSLVSLTGMIAFVLGCSTGGFLVEKIGSRGGFIWDAITFFISGILVLFITPRMKWQISRKKIIKGGREMMGVIRKSVMEEMKEGIAYLINHKEIRFILNMLFILFAAAGAIYVVIIVFIQESFHSVTRDLGVLAIFLGAGLFAGAVLYGRYGQKRALFKTVFICLSCGGLMLMVFSLAIRQTQSLFVGGMLSFLLGLIVGPVIIATNTIIHQVTENEMRGKVFSGLEIVIHFAFLSTMLISSKLSEYVDRFWILVGVGCILSVSGFVGLLKYGKKT